MFAEVKDNTVVQFPYDYDTLCRANPSTAFPNNTHILTLYAGTEANLNGAALVRVIETDPPTFNAATQKLVLLEPSFDGSRWVRTWNIVSLTVDEQIQVNTQKAKAVREQRTQKLKDTDWTQVADAPVDQAAWAAYRQALRDVPSQADFPWGVQWPVEP